jgi:exopolysaccharide biosynthesis polyprenyl glycosylphosphotransferase
MSVSLKDENRDSGNRKSRVRFPRLFLNGKDIFYDEKHFLQMLYVERRRAERSAKRFHLMLLDIGVISPTDLKDSVIRKLKEVLLSLTRETDIKGWYKNRSVVGVIFTESNESNKEILKSKVHTRLCNTLSVEVTDKIRISIYTFPEEDNEQNRNSIDLTLYPDLSKRPLHAKAALLLKRVIDITGSTIALIIFLPFFIVISLCIKATSDGPILFKQERIGRHGKKFIFLKFRTMYTNNNDEIHKKYVTNLIKGGMSGHGQGKEEMQATYKITDDPRVTSIGRILRKTSLDELPQFFNVLKGEMSLVGPRPPLFYEVENYDLWHRRRVFEVKPGITGLWQIMGRSSTTFDEMVRLDLKYIQEWSLWLDIIIMLKTPWAVISCRGAY